MPNLPLCSWLAKAAQCIGMKLGAVTRALMPQRTPEAMQPEALFAEAARLGLQEFEIPTRGWDEPGSDFVERVRDLRQQHHIGVSVNWGDHYVANGPDQPTDEFQAFVERLCHPIGARIVGTVSPVHAGRWVSDPPLAQQLERMAAALRRLAPVAEAGGVRIAVENHADYRGHELASLLERVASPAVGAKLDTGNAFAAVEDPTEAAKYLAPFTFATHVKDVRVEAEPGNRGVDLRGLLVMLEVGLGEGHVDFSGIIPLLAAQGPLGNDLVLTIEEGPRTIGASVQYARTRFVPYLRL
jgi:sugar phosphate isomerase/epimerase